MNTKAKSDVTKQITNEISDEKEATVERSYTKEKVKGIAKPSR